MAIRVTMTRTTSSGRGRNLRCGLKPMHCSLVAPCGCRGGPARFRAIDHQATLGTFVGRTALKAGPKGNYGEMVDWRYASGENYLPGDDAVRKLRPAID